MVASDLSECQRERERLTSSLCLQGMDIPAVVLYAEKLDGKSFTPRERTRQQHEQNFFIVEDYAEDEVGQWAKDEVTGEQGYVDDEKSCFWTWDHTEFAWQSRPFKGRQVKRRKGKVKGKGKGRSKKTRRAFFGGGQTQDPEWRQEEDRVWWSNGKKSKKGLSKGNDGFRKGVFFFFPTKVQTRTFTKKKAEERIKKEKARKEPVLNLDSQPQKHPMKKYMATPVNQTIGLPVIGLMIPGLQMLGGSVQRLFCMDGGNPFESCQPSKNGNQKIQEACMVLRLLRRNSVVCNKIFRDCQFRDRNLQRKLHYPLSNNSTMFYQG